MSYQMECRDCGSVCEWQGPLSNLTHTKCLGCGAIDNQRDNERTGQAGEAQGDFCALTPEEREAVIRADTARAVPRAYSVTLSQWEYDTIRAALSRLSSATTTDVVAVAVAWMVANPNGFPAVTASSIVADEWRANPYATVVPLFAAPPRLQPQAAPDSAHGAKCPACHGESRVTHVPPRGPYTMEQAAELHRRCDESLRAQGLVQQTNGEWEKPAPPADDARDAARRDPTRYCEHGKHTSQRCPKCAAITAAQPEKGT